MPAPPPDPEKIAQALHLRRTQPDLSLRQIAERIGVNSPSTVSTYVALGEQSEAWFPALRREEIGARVDLVLNELMARGLRRMNDEDAVFEKVSPAIVEILREISKRHGLYAPNRTEISAATMPPAPDPEMTQKIRNALDALRTQDGDDDGGPGDGT